MQQNQELESRVLHSTKLQKQLHLPQHLQQIKRRQQQQQQHPYLRRSLPPGLSPLGALSPVPPWLRPPLLEPEELAEEDKDVVVIEGGEEDDGPVILEGDIAVDREENYFRLGLRWDRYPQKKWTNNTVPYKISSEYRPREYRLIESALKTFQFLSCLRFEPWDGRKEDYLYIHHSKKRPGCWSYIGRRGGRQDLSLRPPDYPLKRSDEEEEEDKKETSSPHHWWRRKKKKKRKKKDSCHCMCDVGRILHEMMHALGFYHEHSRPDRDQHIDIVQENVQRGRLKNFNKIKAHRAVYTEFGYDYESIMHYGPYFFSQDKSRKKTIIPLLPGARIGQRETLSALDCMKLNAQYGCFDRADPWKNKKIQAICGLMGFSYQN